jgi:5-methylcytosine-specific restriction protein A
MSPMAARHYCNKAGCHAYAVPGSGYCALHQRSVQQDYDRTRANDPTHAFYKSPQWRAVREQYLSIHPVCAMCEKEGLVTVASVCHHIIEVTARPDLSLDPQNLVALCSAHHNLVHGGLKGGSHDQ